MENRLLHYSLPPWIDVNKLDWESFKSNINATYYFRANRDNVDWRILYPNDAAIKSPCRNSINDYHDIEFEYVNRFSCSFTLPFLIDNIMNFFVCEIMSEPHVIKFTIHYLQYHATSLTHIHWMYLSKNCYAIDLLVLNEDKINWEYLSLNCHWKAIELLERNPDKIHWRYLSRNSGAIHILEKNWDKIDWQFLSNNEKAIHILEKNQDKIDWTFLSGNPGAMRLLQKNQDKINWEKFSMNPSIVKEVVDYDVIKKNMDIIREELLSKTMHPRRLQRWIDMGGNIDDF